jgi:hypothetical protein
MRSASAAFGRATTRLAGALTLLGLLAGVPAFLGLAFGWPLPTTIPTRGDGWQRLLTDPIPDTAILRLLAIAAWLLWAAFARALWIEARDAWRGVKTPHRLPGFHPLRTLASVLVVTIAAGTIATAASALPTAALAAPTRAPVIVASADMLVTRAESAPAAASTTVLATAPAHAAPLLPAGPAILQINGCAHLHTVVRGESLWAIAEHCLGDPTRWPEIWQLNEGKFWPEVSGYKKFDDPDLIYPRWTLELPADAVAPPDDPQVEPADPPPAPSPSRTATPTPDQTTPGPTTPSPTTTGPSTPRPTEPDGVVPEPSDETAGPVIVAPGTSPTRTTTPTVIAPPTSTSANPTPSTSTGAAPAGSPSQPPTTRDDEHGVTLPDGSWVPWALAAALAAASAMVWLQRRRRHVPGMEDEYADLPAPVRQLERATRRNPDLPKPTDEVERATTVPPQALPPLGGVGLVGEGAAAAARAALVTALAAGGPHRPHDRAEIIIDAATLATLIGPDAVQLAEWPRLHIADDAEAALLRAEAEILRRGRILSYHTASTLAELREQVPDEEALPPVLLLCQASPAIRLEVTAGIGAHLNITTLLMGEWSHGPTLHVTVDGHTRLVGERIGEHPLPDRMAVLEPDAAAQILLTLREAHTGLRPDRPQPNPRTVTTALADAGRADEPPAAETAANTAPADEDEAPARPVPAKVRLHVLGAPDIDDVTGPGRPLRGKARELAVFLACHPDGAATRDIGEHLSPDYTLDRADQQVHTNASNLRHVFGRAGGPREDAYVQRLAHESSSRYRLDPATVEVDLWQLRDLLRAATLASGERRRDLLAAACALYTGPLAEGYDYEWIGPYRETARRWGTEAHQLYAETLLDTDPQAAADALDHAIRLDRHNEQLYMQAMHARHALRDSEGLRVIMRALTKALADIDAEPSEDTSALYQRLRASLDQR